MLPYSRIKNQHNSRAHGSAASEASIHVPEHREAREIEIAVSSWSVPRRNHDRFGPAARV